MNDREIKYLLTGDAAKLKNELASVEKAAEQAGKSIDRALTNAFKGSANALTAEFAKNLETINKGLSTVQKGTQNAFNAQNIAQYAKVQSSLANELQKLEVRYRGLDRTANTYRETLTRTGTDAATAGSITSTWLERQRAAIHDTASSLGGQLGPQFGGLANLAPTIAAGIKQIDDEANATTQSAGRLVQAMGEMNKHFKKIPKGLFSEASKDVLKFGESINKASGNLARMGAGLVAALAVFATIPLLKTISTIESAQLGLESLTKSAEQAGLAIYRLYTYANETPYETASLIAYEQKLVSVGLTGQQAFGVIQRVSDIGGAFGASSDQLDRFYYVLSQIFGAGRAMGQDFLQIQNSLPGFISAIGEVMGKSAGEVRAAFGDGSVTSQVIVKALNNLTKKGGLAFQGAIKQSSTFAGILNNLADNLKRVGLAFFGVTVTQEGMIVATEGLYQRLKNLLNTILDFASNPLVLKVFGILGESIGNVLSLLEQYPQTIAIVFGLFLAFATDLISRIPFIGNLIGEIGYGTGLLVGLFGALVTASQEVQRALAVALGIAIKFIEDNKSLFRDLLANFQQFLQVIGQGVAPALIIATRLFFGLAKAILVVINTVITTATAIANFLGPSVTQAITLFTIFLGVGVALTPVILSIVAALAALRAMILSTAAKVAVLLAALFALVALLGGFGSKGVPTGPLDALTDIFNNITESTDDTASGINDVAGALDGAGNSAKKATKQLAAFDKMNVINSPTSTDSGGGLGGGGLGDLSVPEPVLPDLSKLKDNLKTALDGLKEIIPKVNWWDFLIIPAGVFAAWSLLSQIFKGLPSPLKVLQNAFTALRNHIVKVFTGLGPAVAGAIKNFGTTVVNGFKNIGPRIISVFTSIGPAIGRVFTQIGPLLAKAGPEILRSVLTIGSNVARAFGPIGWAISAALAAALLLVFNWETVSQWFSTLWTNITTWFSQLGQTIGTLFLQALQGAFGPIPQIFASIVVVVVALIATIIGALAALPGWVFENVIMPLGEFFGNLWMGISDAFILAFDLIKQILGVFGEWINTNVIQPVAGFFAGLWEGVKKGAQNVWNGIVAFFSPIFGWIKTNIIDPVAGAFTKLWNGITSVAGTIFSKISGALAPIFNWINQNVITPVRNIFEKLGSAIGTVFKNVSTTISNIFDGVVNTVKGVFNGIIDAINKVIDAVNNIKVPKEVPVLGGLSPNFPKIPRLARGGVVDDATLALIGENGREAVMPLENNTGWIDELAAKLGNATGSQQPTVVNVYLDGNKVGGAISNSINDRTIVTGVNQIYV